MAQKPTSGLGHLIVQLLRPHSIRHTKTSGRGVFWTNDQLVTRADTYTAHIRPKILTSMSSAGFKPAIPAIEPSQTYALDRTTIGISTVVLGTVI